MSIVGWMLEKIRLGHGLDGKRRVTLGVGAKEPVRSPFCFLLSRRGTAKAQGVAECVRPTWIRRSPWGALGRAWVLIVGKEKQTKLEFHRWALCWKGMFVVSCFSSRYCGLEHCSDSTSQGRPGNCTWLSPVRSSRQAEWHCAQLQ